MKIDKEWECWTNSSMICAAKMKYPGGRMDNNTCWGWRPFEPESESADVCIFAASFLRPPSALLYFLSRPEVVDFVPQRPLADSASAKLIVVLTPRLPALWRRSWWRLLFSAFFVFLCITFLRVQRRPKSAYVSCVPMIARPNTLPFIRLEFIIFNPQY